MLYLRKNPINWLKNNLSFPPAQAVVLSVRKCREHPHGHRGESNTGSEVPWVVEHPFAVCCGVKPLIPLLQGQCHGQQGTAAGRFPKLTVVWRSRKASSVLVMHPIPKSHLHGLCRVLFHHQNLPGGEAGALFPRAAAPMGFAVGVRTPGAGPAPGEIPESEQRLCHRECKGREHRTCAPNAQR